MYLRDRPCSDTPFTEWTTPRPIIPGPHPEATITLKIRSITQEHLDVLRLSLLGMAQLNEKAQDLLAAIDEAQKNWRS